MLNNCLLTGNLGGDPEIFYLIGNTLEFIKTDGRGFEEGQDRDNVPF